METQKTVNSQSNLEKEKWSWRNQAPWLQTIIQSYSPQNSIILAQKQKYRPMEQDRKFRDKPMHLQSPNLWQWMQKYTMEKRKSLNKWCWKNWAATCKRIKLEHTLTPYTKIYLKWIKDLDVRLDTIKLCEENIRRTLFDINRSKMFFNPLSRVKKIKIKIKINGT